MAGSMSLPLAEINALCAQYGVKRLTLFGSAATDRFDAVQSDADFLVEFAAGSKTLDHYFGFRRALEDLLGRPVDLVAPKALRNPYFAATVAQTQQTIYDAA